MQKFKSIDNNQIFLLPPSVEEFIKDDHLARLISEVVNKLDTSSIEKSYSFLGQKSYHPRLLLKLWIYGYATGTLSGRKIAMMCETDTAYMFLAGMYTPDFRTINDFRKDNIEFFSDCFKQVLQICRELGMGKVGLIAIDGTKIWANASAKKSFSKGSYQQWLVQIDEQINHLQQQADEINAKEDGELLNQRGDELPEQLMQKKQLRKKIEDALSKIKSEDKKVNLTDPESSFMKCGGLKKPGYNCQGASSQDGLILAAYATCEPNDKEQLAEVINQVQENTKEDVGIVLADSGYSSYEIYQWLEQQSITAYIPDQDQQMTEQRKADPYDRVNFTFNESTNTYTCPTGQPLAYSRTIDSKTRKQHYKLYEGLSCNECAVKTDCTAGSKRQIHQELRESLREAMRQRTSSKEGKQIYKKRLNMIEHVWGNIKFNCRITRFHLRGLQKVNAETQLLAIGHNLKKLFTRKEQLLLLSQA